MDQIPVWLGAIGIMLVIASTLGAAVAVYKTSAQGTSLLAEQRTVERLRGEIGDYMRREAELLGDVKVLNEQALGCRARLTIVEELLIERKDDEEIRSEIAAVRKVVDENVLTQLTAILTAINEWRTPNDHS